MLIASKLIELLRKQISVILYDPSVNLTHSCTLQPLTSTDSHLLRKFFLILQEKENEFGKIVQKDSILPAKVVVRASKSGKGKQ